MKRKNIILSAVMLLFFFGLSFFAWFKSPDDFSEAERRRLQQLPQISSRAVFSGRFMQDFESYAQDQFPLRDSFRSLKAMAATRLFGNLDNNGIYISGGCAVKMEYPLNEASVIHAAERFEYVYDKYLAGTGAKAYISVIPDKNYFTAADGRHLSMDYRRLTELIRTEADFAQYIDIFPTLDLDSYYKTDTHWRQEKLIPTAQTLAEAMGTEISTDFSVEALDREFYGVYRGQAALPMESETIYYLQSGLLENTQVFDYQNNRSTTVYDMEKGMGKDAYELFLSGPISLICMDNPMGGSGRELIIFRDSFGSSIAPLLLSGYDRVTLVDIRYIHPDMLSKFIEFDSQDVLFLYSSSVLNSSETIK